MLAPSWAGGNSLLPPAQLVLGISFAVLTSSWEAGTIFSCPLWVLDLLVVSGISSRHSPCALWENPDIFGKLKCTWKILIRHFWIYFQLGQMQMHTPTIWSVTGNTILFNWFFSTVELARVSYGSYKLCDFLHTRIRTEMQKHKNEIM